MAAGGKPVFWLKAARAWRLWATVEAPFWASSFVTVITPLPAPALLKYCPARVIILEGVYFSAPLLPLNKAPAKKGKMVSQLIKNSLPRRVTIQRPTP